MFRGSVKGTGYPLHSPVSPSLLLLASPCGITFQLDSTSSLNLPNQSRLFKHTRLAVAGRRKMCSYLTNQKWWCWYQRRVWSSGAVERVDVNFYKTNIKICTVLEIIISCVLKRAVKNVLVDIFTILTIKPTICTNFSNLFFWLNLYVFRAVPLFIIGSFSLYTQQYIQVCWQLALKLSANLYDLYHCCVYSEILLMMDRGTVCNM